MARKRKVSDVIEADLSCYYCNQPIPDNAIRCPHCGKMFSIGKKIIAVSIVLILVAASMGFLAYDYYTQGGHEGYDGDDDILPPLDNNDDSSKIIRIQMYTDKAPITAGNFIDLAEQGKYDGVPFHRVIDSFMIQGGDFTNGDGTGGHAAEYHEGYGDPTNELTWVIPDEFHPDLSNVRGTLSMANSGPNTGGSQFFINTVDNTYLDYTSEPSKHAVFGAVVSGMNIVDEIGGLPTDASDRPTSPVTIETITIINSGGITYADMKVSY